MFIVAGGHGPEVFEFIEEALNGIALLVDPLAKREGFDAVGHGADVCPCAPFGHRAAQGVTVIGAIGEQDVPGLVCFEHVGGRAAVMSLAFSQFEADRPALGRQGRGSWSGRLFLTVGGMLMHADRGRVDPLRIAIVSGLYGLPVTCLAPPVEMVDTGRVRAVGRSSAIDRRGVCLPAVRSVGLARRFLRRSGAGFWGGSAAASMSPCAVFRLNSPSAEPKSITARFGTSCTPRD